MVEKSRGSLSDTGIPIARNVASWLAEFPLLQATIRSGFRAMMRSASSALLSPTLGSCFAAGG